MELGDLQQQRILKLERLREQGIDPYPPRAFRTNTAAEASENFDELQGEAITLVGRLMTIRVMGKSSFAHIMDSTGTIQLYFRINILGEEKYDLFRHSLDLGDFIQATGALFRTKTGEITLEVRSFTILTKSLHPLPEKWHGLTDIEKRYRQRYVDLIVNKDVRDVFVTRTRITSAMRQFLDERGFLEVETPVLQPIYGGAAARPFITHHHALDRDLFLRISDELYLKRLLVGGFERVYEISKDFRNEGIDAEHNPEFTQMEAYQAYADYNDMMNLTEAMVGFIALQVRGTTEITFNDQSIDLKPPWRRLPLRQAVLEHAGIDYDEYADQASLYAKVREMGREVSPTLTWGKLVDELLSTYVEPNLIQPTFIMDYPVELSPLAKRKPDNPDVAERFEPFIGGLELGNAFTELNDPLDQLERFKDQARQRAAGDEEAQPLDVDFVHALMYGMPPTGGLGIGIDRLTMLLTNQTTIREVILFPQMRSR
ncbi:MAG: lysine--tRNA ligase [Chloroflexi bacterium]|nr:lysine--tRNA ligase [Chloroflexota bacterium]